MTPLRAIGLGFATALVVALIVAPVQAQHDVVTRANVEYVVHDGVKLSGDLYSPRGLAKAPVVIAVHGGGWQNGTRDNWKLVAPYLAKKGIAVFAIYATIGENRPRFLLVHGTEDDVVDPLTQSVPFQVALKQAGIPANRVVIPGAAHGFASDPFETDPNGPMAIAVPRIGRFLEGGL